jgi:alkanesulfonate monooxygenase SsuD/methylene tetrahydromethanopterin reductase-like flavin-dependent oxidoreductase (luciferase family)
MTCRAKRPFTQGIRQVLKLGYKLMSEEHGPAELVANARRAEQAGFDFAAISDHFFPWIEEQGHAPLAWTVLGAIANATTRLGLMTAVTCPTMRYHPAIVAQGAATLGLLSNNRFSLGLGSGERLNEHVVGMGWPGIAERHARFGEAVDIIKGLLAGNLQNYMGKYLKLENARLYDRPQRPPPIVIAAGGPKAARFAAEKGCGLMATEARADLIDAFRGAGGAGPRYAEVARKGGAADGAPLFSLGGNGVAGAGRTSRYEGICGRKPVYSRRGHRGKDHLRTLSRSASGGHRQIRRRRLRSRDPGADRARSRLLL